MSDTAGRASFRAVFSVAEFRALWAAQILSAAGDQLAKVAVTVLVYERTSSPVLAAITFAGSFVPTFAGGILLAGLADRRPRRAVMLTSDLVRMVLAAVMALPGLPLAVLVTLLFVITAIGAPFNAARAATYPEILAGDRYVTGTAVTLTTFQLAQVIGFAAGGALTGLLGARPCLLLDAATFAASALLIRAGVTARPAASAGAPRPAEALTGLRGGVRLVFSNPALRVPMLFGWLAATYNAPEGIAAPLARELGGGALATGLLLAAPAAGYSVSALVFSRLAGPPLRARLMGPLAIACCAVLLPMALRPDLTTTLVIFAASGCFQCFQPVANAAFVAAAPPDQRSQAFGLAVAGMSLLQGAAMILAGVAAQHLAPAVVTSAAGALGAGAALVLTIPLLGHRLARARVRPGGSGPGGGGA